MIETALFSLVVVAFCLFFAIIAIGELLKSIAQSLRDLVVQNRDFLDDDAEYVTPAGCPFDDESLDELDDEFSGNYRHFDQDDDEQRKPPKK